MKRILLFSVFSLILGATLFSQPYFQATFVNPANPTPPPATLNQLVFKIKPTANITTAIALMQFSFRYPTASTPPFTIAISSNTTNFPSLNIQRLPDDVDATYTYVNFTHNTGTIASKAYTAGTEYEVFTISLLGSAAIAPLMELYSDLAGSNAFGIVDGGGNLIDVGSNDELYGTGFSATGSVKTVPLANIPVPVKFLGFTAIKKNNTAVIAWSIENESSITERYEILRSSNGVDFKTTATIYPKNNGRSANTYELTENNISSIGSNSGIIYYRIKQTDKDGKFVFTEVRSIRLDGKVFAVSVYPNPIKNLATISIDAEKDADILMTINDAGGRQLQSIQLKAIKGLNTKKVNIASLAAGSYILKVQAGTEIKTIPLVKVNN